MAPRKKAQDELRNAKLDEFLSDYESDRADGKTVRALHAALEKHTERDDDRFDSVQQALLDMKPRDSKLPKFLARPLTYVLLAIATVAGHAIVRCGTNAAAATPAAPATAASSTPAR